MKEGEHLKDGTVFLMIFVALFCDALQAIIGWIPVVGNIFADILSIFIFMTFLLWFYMNGIKMMTPKRFGSLTGGGVIEMIPYINILPAWTMVVVYLIGTTKIEELAAEHPGLASAAVSIGNKINKIKKPGSETNVPGVDGAGKNESKNGKSTNNQDSKDVSNKKESENDKKKVNNKPEINPNDANEINELKKDLVRYASEIQQWKSEMSKKEEILKGQDATANIMIKSAKESGDENRARQLSDIHYRGRAAMADEVISLSRKIRRNEDLEYSRKNMLANLEKNNNKNA